MPRCRSCGTSNLEGKDFYYEEDYNKFRGAVIGKSESISGSQFGLELFKILRNGESDISNIEFRWVMKNKCTIIINNELLEVIIS